MDYWYSAVLIPFLVLSLAGLGLNLLTGYAGQLSLGSAAFMAVGAFAAYNFQLRVPHLPLLVSFALGGLAAAGVGVVFGLPSLRIKGFYLIVSTLAAQFFVEWAFTRFGWFSNDNASGVITAPPLKVAGLDFSSPGGRFALTLVIVVVLTILARNLVRSEIGRHFMAVRDMDTAAAVIGIRILRTKLLAFAVSSFYCGVAGALWAFAYLGTVEPHGFDLDRSYQVLFIIILGGLGSIAGAFLGAAFIVLLPIVMDRAAMALFSGAVDPGHLENLQKVVFGGLIVLFLVKEPEGLARLFRNLVSRRNLMRRVNVGGAVALVVLLAAGTARAGNEQYFPLQSYRVGPYAAGGSGFFGGFIDYLQLVNARDGGVNGVKLTWSECETEYVVERGVECYERLKKGLNGAPVAATNPLSVGIAYATIDRQTADKIPLITINHGRTDSTDGSVFPYIFPLQLNPYSEIAAIVTYIARQAGGEANLKGKKIVTLYHGSPYGKETIPILDLYAKKLGFEITHLEVPHPGNEQQSQWLNIRRIKPDWVILRGWGVMNPVAIKTAAKTGYPVDHMIGNIWSNAEEDVRPAGPVGKGYIAITTGPSGTDFPVLKDIEKHVIRAGKGNLEDPKRFGSIYYNLGVENGILNVEAVRTAQARFGKRPLTGEEVRWGFENLNIDERRLKELGALGLLQRIKLSCSDHEGGGAVRFQQWDGQKWVTITDWVQPDRALLRPIIEASAKKYAQEKGITPRDCARESREAHASR